VFPVHNEVDIRTFVLKAAEERTGTTDGSFREVEVIDQVLDTGMFAGDTRDLKLRFKHTIYITVRNAMQKTDITGLMTRDESICVPEIIFCITAAGRIHPLSRRIRNIPENTTDGVCIIIG
jgi:hypothetical protein